MWQAIVVGVLAGVMGGNAFPHFVRGITRERYPNATGNGPIPNLVTGWAGLVIAALLAWWAAGDGHPGWAWGAAAGVLAIGLFHAGPGAFGRHEGAPGPAPGRAAGAAHSPQE